MLEVGDKFSVLRQQIIQRVIEMKNGYAKCTPQPEAAREELAFFVALLPHLNLNAGVKQALEQQKETAQ